MRSRYLLAVVALVLLLRVPFLNQPIQGDDIYYLAGAQHAQIDPLHPNHARYVFLGDVVDMRGHPHPPLNAWFLALLLAVFGDIHEVPYHTAYVTFSLIAAVGTLWLARRFTPRPALATALFLATPAFAVNGNSLEADLPFLAFWIASIALFLKAVTTKSPRWLGAAALAMLLTALTAYQAILMLPILGIFLWLRRRNWVPGWIALLSPLVALAVWQLYERLSTGALPASVLAGHFQTYGLQTFQAKLRNAAALTAHTGWLVFPLLAVAAFRKLPLPLLVLPLVAAAGAMWVDLNPLFWFSFGAGVLVLLWCLRAAFNVRDIDSLFLAAWVVLFFAAALLLFFAGSARYLLPIAAPIAILATRNLASRPRWLTGGLAAGLALSLSLVVVNYQHWHGYRRFANALKRESETRRVWINGEWGLRFYFESDGGLPIQRGQAVRPGDVVVSSRLAYPIAFTTGGGVLAPLAEQEIRAALPFRLIALGARSAYSTASLGLRPFDLTTGPIDRVRAEVVVERRPTRDFLPMNAPEAAEHIVSGIYELEDNRFRWMSERAIVLLKRPPAPLPLQVTFHVPARAPARLLELRLDGALVAQRAFAFPGTYTLASPPLMPAGESAIVSITTDKTFSVPGDHRRLGIILIEIGFKR